MKPHQLSCGVTSQILLAAILTIAFCLSAKGQTWTQYDQGTPPQHAAGVSPVGSYLSTDLGTVNLTNGSLNLSLPMGSVGGRGFNIPISLNYSSKVWSVAHESVFWGYPHYIDVDMAYARYAAGDSYEDFFNRVAPGWVISGMPLLKRQGVSFPGCPSYSLYALDKLTVVLPDKGEIELRDDVSDGAPLYMDCTPNGDYRGTRWHATDGSGIVFISDNDNGVANSDLAGTLITGDGMRYRFVTIGGTFGRATSVTDRNGNKIIINYSTDQNGKITTEYVDQLGRSTKVEEHAPDPANGSVILALLVTIKGYQGTPQYYKVKTEALGSHIRSDFNCNGQKILTGNEDHFGYCYSGGQPPAANYLFPSSYCQYQERIDTQPAVSQVILPDGRSLSFNYNLYGEVAEVVLPTGGKLQYDYTEFTDAGFPSGNTPGGEYQGQMNSVPNIDRAVTERRSYPNGSTLEGTTSYLFGPQTVNGSSSACTEVKSYAGTTAGTLLSDQRHFFLPAGRYLTGSHGNMNGTGYSLWSTGVEWRTEVRDAAGAVISASEQDWAQRTPVSWSSGYTQQQPANDNRVSQGRRYLDDGSFAKTDTVYDNANYARANNVTEVREYDFGQTFKRLTKIIYVTGSYQLDDAIHLLSLVQQQSIYSDSAATNEVARTVNVYDVYADDGSNYWMDDRGVVIGHDNSYGTGKITRGNLTATGRWVKSNNTTIYSYLRYDTLGNPVSNKDAKGNVTTLSYSDDFGDGSSPGGTTVGNFGATFALPTKITSPAPTPGAPVHLAYTQFDFWSGLLTGFKDRNGIITQTIYNDPFSRPTLVKSALNTAVESHAVMYYAPQTVFGVTLSNNDVLTAKDQITVNDAALRSWTHTDGFGRTVETWSRDPQGDNKVSTVYDALGRVKQQSNPFRPSGENAIYTTTVYDLAGRLTSVTTPDSAVVNTYYSGNLVLVKDQMSKERMSKTNALGQLTDVWEITGADDATESVSFPNHGEVSTGYRTKYNYDTLGNLTTVTQQKGTNGPTQTRDFVYNSLSQLTDATNPESGHIVYDYDSNGNLLHKTDARPVTTTYAYDALNRNVTTDYSDTTGVNPDVTRAYDGATNGKGRLWESYAGGNETAGSNVEHQKITSYDEVGRPRIQRQRFKLNGSWSQNIYETQQLYNLAGEATSQIYPSGHTVAYAYDTAGRTNSFTGNLGDGTQRNYSTEILYSPLGGMTKEKLGTDTAIYNKLFYNSRGQLAEIREGTSYTGPSDSGWERGAIINYYSTCWGMCGGSNSTTPMTDNNGNLKKQEVFVPGANSWLQQYDYDNLNRLQRVHEYTGNQSLDWQQEYLYDRYGNRRIEQDVTKTYGANINKKDFAANTANNNRLGVPAGQTGTMTYDNAGNLTTDTYSQPTYAGAGARVYDAENRMTSAQDANGGWSYYSYNADGQRVRRTVPGQPSAVTTWQVYGFGGELLAEYAASAAPASPQKEYGYRNGQLLITSEPPTGQPPPLKVQDVSWANVTNTVTVTGNSIQKTGGVEGWDAGAVSTQTIASGDGDGNRAGVTGTWRMCGLGNGDSNTSYTDIEYALYVHGDGGLHIYESGNYRGQFGNYTPSDHLKVAVEAGVVKYYRNGTLLYTSTVAPQYPLQVDTSLKTVNASVSNVVLASNVQNVTWTNVTSTVQATSNSIQKTSGVEGWDAGAVSTQTIASGDGYVEFVPGATGTWRMCGLGNGDSNTSYTDIEYALYVHGDGGLHIYESGNYRGQFGNYTPSDHLKVAVEAGVVKYYRNGTLLYTSTVAPQYPLQVDTSLKTVNASISNVVITSTAPLLTGNTVWLVTDQLGTPRMIFDQSGSLANTKRHDYLPFGEELMANQGTRTTTLGYVADSTRQKFTQKERDAETDLDYFLARYYSSKQGRFTSPDEFAGGPDELYDFADAAAENPTFYADLSNPQSLNKYQYTYNNPLNLTDNDGHCPTCPGYRGDPNKQLDALQTVITIIGVVPGVGDAADLVNAGISATRGNWKDAAADAAGSIPVIGSVFPIGNRIRKLVKTADKVDDAIDTANVLRKTDNVADATRAGKPFTKNGKQEVIEQNKAQNNGTTKCNDCGTQTVPGQQSKKGVPKAANETQVDHKKPKSRGGEGRPQNGQVLCRLCNQKKGNTLPE